MALIDTVRRLARLGFYFGLGAVSAAFDACGNDTQPTPDAHDTTSEATEDSTTTEDVTTPDDVAAPDDATAPDEAASDDAEADDGEDLWDDVCE